MRHIGFLVVGSEFALDGEEKDFKIPLLLKPGRDAVLSSTTTFCREYYRSGELCASDKTVRFFVRGDKRQRGDSLDGLLDSAVGCKGLQLLLNSSQRVSKLLVTDNCNGLFYPVQQV